MPRADLLQSLEQRQNTMTPIQIQAPTEMAISLSEAKLALRIEDDDTSLDPLIRIWVGAITEHAEHVMGRSIIEQNWRLTMPGFVDEIPLKRVPLMQVLSVKYIDTNGVLQELSPSDYTIVHEELVALLIPNASWPATSEHRAAVTIDYVCGFGANSTATPPAIKAYLQAKLVEQFDASNKADKASVQASFIDSLLNKYWTGS
jgi:uncharacterized phiE125 gp8 family phage protein